MGDDEKYFILKLFAFFHMREYTRLYTDSSINYKKVELMGNLENRLRHRTREHLKGDIDSWEERVLELEKRKEQYAGLHWEHLMTVMDDSITAARDELAKSKRKLAAFKRAGKTLVH